MGFEDSSKIIVEEKKVIEYLLNVAHPDGFSKARFFIKCGFRPNNGKDFIKSVIDHAQIAREVSQVETRFGTKKILEGYLQTPLKGEVMIRSIWILVSKSPMLVILYPLKNDLRI
jgi:hypothetical protein